MSLTIKRRLLAGLVLLLQPCAWPAFADTAPDRRAEELRIEGLVGAFDVEGGLRASEKLRARDLLALLDKPDAETLAVSAIQRDLLDDDTLLLEFLIGESRSYLWAVTSSSLNVFELPPRTVIDPLVRDLRDALAQSHQPAQRARAELVANQVSALLLKPVAEKLARKSRIALVLDGSLAGIPFAVLPSPTDMRVSLVMRHEIVVLPSASTLAALLRRQAARPPPSKTLAILADPVFSAADPRLASRPDRATPRSTALDSTRDASALARLPFSRQEAQAIGALLPKGEALMALDFEASRELAVSPELGQYRYLHFATHAIQDGSAPDRSGIVLSRFDRDGRRREGFLEARAIRSLNLSADLVVLSACQTALGREAAANDLASLSQGFLAAGASRVVASLWPVSDAATAELMSRFYRGLFLEKLPPAAALQRAQLGMIKDRRWNSPFNWAGFVLQGDWR